MDSAVPTSCYITCHNIILNFITEMKELKTRDLRLSQRCCGSLKSSGTWHSVVAWVVPCVSKNYKPITFKGRSSWTAWHLQIKARSSFETSKATHPTTVSHRGSMDYSLAEGADCHVKQRETSHRNATHFIPKIHNFLINKTLLHYWPPALYLHSDERFNIKRR